ncbi:MAG: glycosyltransferase family 9 protein [Planctomycetota bacterium]
MKDTKLDFPGVQSGQCGDGQGARAQSVRSPHGYGKMDVMRWVDHWVGLPMCFLLGLFVTLIRKLGVRRSRTISGERALAVFKFFGLGSIMEATPLLRAMREQYPRAQLIFVTFQENEHLVRKLNICTELRIIRTSSPLHFVLDVIRQVFWLHGQRVEAVIDLEFFSKFSTLLSFFSRARIRVGFHLNNFWRYSLVTHPIYFNYYRHITDVYHQAAKQIGVQIGDSQLSRLEVDSEIRQSVEGYLKDNGWLSETRLLGVNINAGDMCLERCWPIDRFAALIERLIESHGDLIIVLTGTASERSYVLSLVNLLSPSSQQRVIVSAGHWSLDEFVGALSFFCGYVTNDSGPMHFAAAQEVAMVSIWGPGRPAFYAPKQADHRVIYSDYPCSPCLYMFTTFEAMWCNHEAWCMQAIEVETVVGAVESMLSG